ncbi:hypothetical protein EDB92DRAFT_1820738 [Lactarius akahatsu]|uniref:Uncharacterized protein n=1 Tax=Lactarius akahatsu TaxID=416441 RepID=A0AAD4L7E6_9AGAM|nr:hypothetical protein EDB92DRAFT_1820738 [Lactarius akahatsu]
MGECFINLSEARFRDHDHDRAWARAWVVRRGNDSDSDAGPLLCAERKPFGYYGSPTVTGHHPLNCCPMRLTYCAVIPRGTGAVVHTISCWIFAFSPRGLPSLCYAPSEYSSPITFSFQLFSFFDPFITRESTTGCYAVTCLRTQRLSPRKSIDKTKVYRRHEQRRGKNLKRKCIISMRGCCIENTQPYELKVHSARQPGSGTTQNYSPGDSNEAEKKNNAKRSYSSVNPTIARRHPRPWPLWKFEFFIRRRREIHDGSCDGWNMTAATGSVRVKRLQDSGRHTTANGKRKWYMLVQTPPVWPGALKI